MCLCVHDMLMNERRPLFIEGEMRGQKPSQKGFACVLVGAAEDKGTSSSAFVLVWLWHGKCTAWREGTRMQLGSSCLGALACANRSGGSRS